MPAWIKVCSARIGRAVLYLQRWSRMPRRRGNDPGAVLLAEGILRMGMKLHEYTNAVEPVAAWIEPFLQGTLNVSAMPL